MATGEAATVSPAEYTPRPSATGRDRIDALDGLRAVALLIIMGYHFGVGWLQGGFFSLDIFYVLSGYLITGLLLSEYKKRGRITLSAFWLRRARRLLPALLIVLVVVTLLVRYAAPAGMYPDFRMSALSALFYFSNWWQIAASGSYFVATSPASPLTHTWSLAVEEQFYLIWPLVVLFVLHLSGPFRRGVRNLLVLSVVGALASAVEMAVLYNPQANTTRLYFGTDTHAQSILIGAVLACSLTLIQMRKGAEGMAPAATLPGSPDRPGGPGRGRVRRHPDPHLHPGRGPGLRLPGRVLLVRTFGGGHHPRGGVRARGSDRPPALAPRPGLDRHRLLWRLPVALPGLRLPRCRPGRLFRVRTARLALRSHHLVGRGQLLPGGAAGHVREVLAVGQGHRPGRRVGGGHCGRGGGRHRHPGCRRTPGGAIPPARAVRK